MKSLIAQPLGSQFDAVSWLAVLTNEFLYCAGLTNALKLWQVSLAKKPGSSAILSGVREWCWRFNLVLSGLIPAAEMMCSKECTVVWQNLDLVGLGLGVRVSEKIVEFFTTILFS